ncbi:hypothetical protein Cgig2_031463 [Carnegiea gigantea]|uniref:MORF/ORRM1/DAG-like MORF domain-containing protein n=1 Tax=Carnegiea gigantea TaxID=171969 RepID=A0A9Q1K777_9CARY|nr:hypothetical protein Cgig2_031463 [Carnegiea gigantea]
MQSHRRAFLCLRHQILSNLKSNPPFSRSSTAFNRHSNPNSPSFLFSTSGFSHDHRRLGLKCLISCNFPPLTSNWSFKNAFNGVRSFATRLSESNNRPPKETIMLAGCDWEHWLVVVEAPDPKLTRDEIIDGYIKTLAHVVGSEEEAQMKIYSVSTRHYYAFGALLSEEVAYKLKDQPHVRWVLPDSYLDVKNKTYAGEPFINGQAVPYDPKYHEIWVRNHEASLRSNMKNKRRQRDPNSSRPRSISPPSASLSGSPNENWMPSAGSEYQAPQMSSVQSQEPGHSSLSVPSVSQQNEMPYAHPTSQTPQTSQLPNPPAVSQNQASQQNEMPYAHPTSQTPQTSQLTNPPAMSQNQASQYSQKQNQSSPWAQPPHEPSSTVDPNHQRWENQNRNWSPVVDSQNPAGGPSQMQNPAPQAFSESQAPYYSQIQTNSSPWTPTPPKPFSAMDPNNHNWSPVLGSSRNQARHPSQMQNPAPPPQPTPAMNLNYQSWGKQSPNGVPSPASHNQGGHLRQTAFSQSHAAEYCEIQNQLSPGAALPSEPSAITDENHHNWSNRSWTTSVGSQNKVGHTFQMQKPSTPGFSQSQVPPYSQMQNHSLPGNPPPRPEHSGLANPNYQSWSSRDQNWTSVSRSDNLTNPYQLQNQRHPPSPNPYTSAWNSLSQSWEPAPQYQSQSSQPPVSPHNFSYNSSQPAAPPKAMPSHMQSSNIDRGSVQPQIEHNGYSYRDIAHGAQSGGPQNGHPSNTSQCHTFQELHSSNAMASPQPQGWNNPNMNPFVQNNSFPSTNMGPEVQNQQFQGADTTRSLQNDNFQHKMGQANRQVDSYYGGTMPSYSNKSNMQPREYQERDMPVEEEYMYGPK